MKRKWRKIGIAALSAVLLLGVWWDNNRLVTEEYIYADAALPAAFEGFRIVQLSDLHGRQFGEGNARLIAAAEAARPDLIALTGDFVDEYSSVADLIPLVDGLTALAPVYYVTGNHEWSSGQAQTVLRTLRKLGVYCLENEFTIIERNGEHILLAGIHDPNGYADQKTPEALAETAYDPRADECLLMTTTPYREDTQRLLVRATRVSRRATPLADDSRALPEWESRLIFAAPVAAAGLLLLALLDRLARALRRRRIKRMKL